MFALLSLLPFLASIQAFFILTQPILLTTRLDPIVDPGSIGGHVHTIAGGSNFDKWMDYGTSQASTCTTAPITVDKSNYWIPQLYYYNPATTGYQAIPVAFVNTYYLPRPGKNDTIHAFPDGLRMLSGDPNRREFDGKDVNDQAVSYVCLDYNGNHKGDKEWDQRNSFFNHNCPDGLRAQVNFPTCWDGKNLDSPDHRSHMAWPVNGNNNGGGDCPASHPVKVVQLFYEFIFEVQKFPFNPAGQPTWVWANGDATGYGLHADFINGWPALVNGTNVLQRAINECNVNGGVGGNLQDCPPFQGLINTAQSKGCQPQNPLVAEDVGFGHEIPSLPGNNPLWIGNISKPSISNYTDGTIEYTTGRSILPTGWRHVGCTAEATSGRALTAYQLISPNMTRAMCASECGKRGYPFAGIQFASECRCDYRMRNGASNTTLLPVERCNSKCSGLSTENCGGGMTNDLLVNPALFPPPLQLQAGWEYQGCFTGTPGGKRLLGGATFVSNNMTNEMCVKNCHNAGFTFGGSEYGSECRCANTLPSDASKVSEDQCLRPCAGDSRYGCGDGDRVSLFKFTGQLQDAPVASNTTTPTANPAAPAGVDGWFKRQSNCMTEPSGRRALSGYSTSNGQMSGAACMTLCAARGFAFAGTEWTSECYCGSSIDTGSKEAPMSECNMPCSGASGEMCGGGSRLNMYYLNSSAVAAPTAALPQNWVADGCWNSWAADGKSFNGTTVSNSTINYQVCLGHCQANWFTHAGIEYGRECRCGMGYAPGSVQRPASDCNMPCAGSSTQICGAGNRMTTFRYTGTVTGPSNANIKVDGWVDKGCYTEGKGGRALGRYYFQDAGMTVPMCLAACQARGWRLAGLEYSGECYCSEAIANAAVPTTEGCTMTCKGDKSTLCGGSSRLNVFESTASIPDPDPAGWASMGCMTDDGTRAFRNFSVSSSSMTVGSCISTCSSKGYKYAGVENGDQCYCDNTIYPAGKVAPDGDCSMKCQGNSNYLCGGAWRMSAYYNKAAGAAPIGSVAASTTSTAPTNSTNSTTSTTSSTSSTSTTTTPAATATSASLAWTYRGCYTEGNGIRAVPNGKYLADNKNMSKAFCANYAQANNHSFYALTYYFECFTGNALNTRSNLTAASECSYACSGAKGDICGGNNRASVYSLSAAAMSDPAPPTTKTTTTVASAAISTAMPEGWSMTGCIVDGDSKGQRAFGSYRFVSDSMTWALCASTCAKNGYNMGGVSYASECYCSNNRHPLAVAARDSECNMKCSGDSSSMCGGSWRLNMLAGPGASTGIAASTTTTSTTTTSRTSTTTIAPTTITSSTITTTTSNPTSTTPTATIAAPTGYLGCFTDRSNRQLNGTNIFGDTKNMDNNFCINYCTQRGFAIAGTTYGAECMCGNYLNRSDNITLSDPNSCGMNCAAAGSTQKCGASWQVSIYLTGKGNATIYDQQRKREVRSRRWRVRN